MNNLGDGKVIANDLQYVELDDQTFEKFRLNAGDILFNRTNSFDLVGKVGLFNLDAPFVFASYLIRVVVDRDKVNPEYVNRYLDWGECQARLKMLASRGVSQSNINATKLRGFRIPLPLRSEQQEITDVLSAVDHKIAMLQDRKSAQEQLFKTLLNDLMTARIRVKRLEVEA